MYPDPESRVLLLSPPSAPHIKQGGSHHPWLPRLCWWLPGITSTCGATSTSAPQTEGCFGLWGSSDQRWRKARKQRQWRLNEPRGLSLETGEKMQTQNQTSRKARGWSHLGPQVTSLTVVKGWRQFSSLGGVIKGPQVTPHGSQRY